MNSFAIIEEKLRQGMHQGNMHACLRDTGRLAGGCIASNRITATELANLEALAVSLSINKAQGLREWQEGVKFGQQQPAYEVEFNPGNDEALSWDYEYSAKDYRIVRKEWVSDEYIVEPESWNPCEQLTKYIETLFKPDEYVGYCTETFERDGKTLPTKGVYWRSAREILDELKGGHLDQAVGDYNPESGAWIRINPLDGKGAKDENVTDFRFALVECDKLPLGKQVAIYKQLQLPCAMIVHSGGKSAHAVVRIDAPSMEEYRKRVDFLYEVCGRNGLEIDRQNRNPSRYSRMPGIERNGKKQFIIETNVGAANWLDWYNYIEDLNDDLPEIETAEEAVAAPPPLREELIEGLLRVGHKMRIAGASKAGKSFLLLELAIAIAEGGKWLGRKCKQGRALYVNLELDDASCKRRIYDIYKAMAIKPLNAKNLEIWNLRGRVLPLDMLTPKIIRRCADRHLNAIIIDPIYKVLTGDENAAADMAKFCNYFDRIARDCDCAVIDCHHHSKGGQGGKRSMDRASGSGVFARDPDALLDMIELDAENAKSVKANNLAFNAIVKEIADEVDGWEGAEGVTDRLLAICSAKLPRQRQNELCAIRDRIYGSSQNATAWRIESTLREFPSGKPIDIWFDFPLHTVDDGLLADAMPLDSDTVIQRKAKGKKAAKPSKEKRVRNLVDEIFQDPNVFSVPISKIAEKLEEEFDKVSSRTITDNVDRAKYSISGGLIVKKETRK